MRTLSKVFEPKFKFEENGEVTRVTDKEIKDIGGGLLSDYYIVSEINPFGYSEDERNLSDEEFYKHHTPIYVTYGFAEDGEDEFMNRKEFFKELKKTVLQVHKVFLANELKKLNQKD